MPHGTWTPRAPLSTIKDSRRKRLRPMLVSPSGTTEEWTPARQPPGTGRELVRTVELSPTRRRTVWRGQGRLEPSTLGQTRAPDEHLQPKLGHDFEGRR